MKSGVSMKYKVVNLAEDNLFGIIEYIFLNDCHENAIYVYEKIKDKLRSLETFPYKGHLPRECVEHHLDLLEIHFSVYRIIYTIKDEIVVILAVIDGRRDIKEQFFLDLVASL